MSDFKDRVVAIVRRVPHGKVMSYGQVALYVGIPRAARQVGWILNQTEGKVNLPWWRVVNNAGRISIKGTYFNSKELQRKLLRAEGIEVTEDFLMNMAVYRFVADETFLKECQLSNEYIQEVIGKYFSPRSD